ncbi:MAG: hypothetical protein EOO59_00670, partial [Hymenobacter sp.]
MKNLLTATMPALALLALGGCATTGAISTTENDSVYYSSADHTTVAAQAPAAGSYQPNGYGYESARVQTQTTPAAPANENANPDYQGGTAQTGTTGSSTDYYDDSYTSASPSGFNQPYAGPGVSTYNYTPSWSVSPSFYGSPFGYGAGLSLGYGYGGGFGGYSPFGYGYGYPGYGGFYDPFYSPFGYGYGSGFSIGFGYGGFGGFGYPYGFGSPYGYGYGGYPYSYGGYGYGGDYYGGGYGGARRYVYNNAIVSGGYPNGYDRGAIHVGHRESRVSNAVGSPGVAGPGASTGANSGVVGSRRATNGASSGFSGAVGNAPTGVVGSNPAAAGAYNSPTATDRSRLFGNNPTTPNAPGNTPDGSRADRSAWRNNSNNNVNGNPQGFNQPRTADAAQPQRGGFFRQMFSAPANQGGGQASGFDQRSGGAQRGFSQPEQRGYSQPRMEQRSFSQPMQSPSFGGS